MALIKVNARSASALDATILTGNLPAISGASLTGVSAGKVLQVVASSNTSMTSHTRGQEMTAFLTSITPSATSSKILVLVSVGMSGSDSASDNGLDVRRKIGSGSFTDLQSGSGASSTNTTFVPYMSIGAGNAFGMSFQLLDSPSTTSECSYQLRCQVNSGRTMYTNRRNGTDYGTSSGITLLEIEG